MEHVRATTVFVGHKTPSGADLVRNERRVIFLCKMSLCNYYTHTTLFCWFVSVSRFELCLHNIDVYNQHIQCPTGEPYAPLAGQWFDYAVKMLADNANMGNSPSPSVPSPKGPAPVAPAPKTPAPKSPSPSSPGHNTILLNATKSFIEIHRLWAHTTLFVTILCIYLALRFCIHLIYRSFIMPRWKYVELYGFMPSISTYRIQSLCRRVCEKMCLNLVCLQCHYFFDI